MQCQRQHFFMMGSLDLFLNYKHFGQNPKQNEALTV